MSNTTRKPHENVSLLFSKMLLFVLLSICTFFLSSCTTSSIGRYTPNPSISKEVKIKIVASEAIAIINAQSSSSEQQLGYREMIVSKQKWTQALIESLTSELKNNGVVVRDDAKKQLHVSITNIDLILAFARYQGFLDAVVTGEGGLKETFKVDKVNYASSGNVAFFPTKPIDECFRALVEQILENENIKEYIRK